LVENKAEPNVLENALNFTGTDEAVLENLMFKALDTLRKASGMLYGYKGNAERFKEIKEIESVVTYMITQMEPKQKKKK